MVRGSTLELMDHTYDGVEDSRTGDLRGGLGQLVDGRYGYDNFKASSNSRKGHLKGFDWLGWKKKANQAAISLVFAFDQVRTFERVDIHANNHFTKDIQVFRQAKVYFSNEEDKFGDDRFVDFKYMPDLAIENARNVSINLKKEHGQFVMLQLYFNAKWILISEVTFYSEPKIDKPFEIPKINEDLYQEDIDEDTMIKVPDDVVEVAPIDIDIHTYPANHDPHDTTKGEEGNSKTVGIVIGILLTIISVLLMGILWVVYRSKNVKEKRTTPTHSLLTTGSSSKACPDRFTSSLDFKGLHHPATTIANMQYTPYSSNVADAEASQKTSYDQDTIYEEPLNSKSNYLSTEDLTDEYAEPGGSSLHMSNSLCENIYTQVNPRKGRFLPPLPLNEYARPQSPPSQQPQVSALTSLALPPPPPPIATATAERRPLLYRNGGTTPLSSSSSSNSPNTKFSTSVGSGLEKQPRRPSKSSRPSTLKKKKQEPTTNYYASNDVILPINGGFDLAKLYAQVNKTSEDTRPNSFKRSTSIDTVNVTLNEIDKEDLQVVQKLGEGQFGEIHLCRISLESAKGLPEDLSTNLVAVKSLKTNCDEASRSDFEHEARILSSLNDPNLVRVLGVCFDNDEDASDIDQAAIPIGMVCEYTEEGDLCQYLQDHVAETTLTTGLTKSPNVPTLR